jgi:hypothetical protein
MHVFPAASSVYLLSGDKSVKPMPKVQSSLTSKSKKDRVRAKVNRWIKRYIDLQHSLRQPLTEPTTAQKKEANTLLSQYLYFAQFKLYDQWFGVHSLCRVAYLEEVTTGSVPFDPSARTPPSSPLIPSSVPSSPLPPPASPISPAAC